MTQKDEAISDHPIFRWAIFTAEHLSTIADSELATLKIHVVIEEALRHLLAARLGVSDDRVVALRLRFELTCELALMGIGDPRDPHLVGGIRALNDARNCLAHSIDKQANMHKKLEVFVREIGYMTKRKVSWPTSSPEQLDVLGNAFDQTARAIFDLVFKAEDQRDSNSKVKADSESRPGSSSASP